MADYIPDSAENSLSTLEDEERHIRLGNGT